MICAARNGAQGFRVESWAEGRGRREVGADDRCLPTNSKVCDSDARQPDEPQSPTAKPPQEALRDLGFAVMGRQLCLRSASRRRKNRGLDQTKPRCSRSAAN
jgi:hypothetical protein